MNLLSNCKGARKCEKGEENGAQDGVHDQLQDMVKTKVEDGAQDVLDEGATQESVQSEGGG